MAVCKKVLLVWCLLVAQSCALRVKREDMKAIDDNVVPEMKFDGGAMHDSDSGSMHSDHNSYSDDSKAPMPAQRKCPEYHSCMNRLDELQDSMKSLKSERAVMMGTLKTIINKGKDQQQDINKLAKRNKMLVEKYAKNDKNIRPKEVQIAKNVRTIGEMEDKKNSLYSMITNWRDTCDEAVQDLTETEWIEGTESNYYPVYDRTNGVNWFEAQEFCKAHGMDLVTIDNEAELTELGAALGALNSATDEGIEDTGFWLGHNALASEGNLRWADTGVSNSLSLNGAWHTDEPDFGDEFVYTCVNWYVDVDGFLLSVENPLLKSGFVCEQSKLCYDIGILEEWLAEEALSGESDGNSSVNISSDVESSSSN